MKYLSLFSGIEAATVAWHPMGWQCVGVAEIEKFPSAVLGHHYPDVPNLGDITKITEEQIIALGHIDVIVGGFPCQDLSVAGKRKGLKNADGSNTRSGLFYDAMRIVGWARKHCGLRWLLVENVPGLLSSGGGADFACVLGEMVGTRFDPPKNKWENTGMAIGPDGLAEWCILDAQWFGVAQRRRRVFALCDYSVGSAGIDSRSGPILFEPEGMSGNPPPSRQARKDVAPTLAARTKGGGGLGTDFDCDGGCIPIQEPGKRTGRSTTDTGCGLGIGADGDQMLTLQAGAVHGVAHTLKGEGFDASEDGTGRGTPLVPVKWPAEIAPTLNASFGDKQGLEDQHALNGGGYSSLAKCLTAKSQRNDFETETLLTVKAPPIAFNWNAQPDQMNFSEDTVPTLTQSQGPAIGFQDDTTPKATVERIGAQRADAGGEGACVAFQSSQSGVRTGDVHATLDSNNGSRRHNGVVTRMAVRRLTPTECERLQGFPDHYTQIPFRGKPSTNCPDGPRYKALGNSMAVPCMAWIGKRIAASQPEPLNLDE